MFKFPLIFGLGLTGLGGIALASKKIDFGIFSSLSFRKVFNLFSQIKDLYLEIEKDLSGKSEEQKRKLMESLDSFIKTINENKHNLDNFENLYKSSQLKTQVDSLKLQNAEAKIRKLFITIVEMQNDFLNSNSGNLKLNFENIMKDPAKLKTDTLQE